MESSNSLPIPDELSIAALIYLLVKFGGGFNIFGMTCEKLICQYQSDWLTLVVCLDECRFLK